GAAGQRSPGAVEGLALERPHRGHAPRGARPPDVRRGGGRFRRRLRRPAGRRVRGDGLGRAEPPQPRRGRDGPAVDGVLAAVRRTAVRGGLTPFWPLPRPSPPPPPPPSPATPFRRPGRGRCGRTRVARSRVRRART